MTKRLLLSILNWGSSMKMLVSSYGKSGSLAGYESAAMTEENAVE